MPWQRLFLDAPIGMALLDDEGRYVRVNPSLCTTLGYAEEQLIGRCFSALTHSDDREDDLRRLADLRSGSLSAVECEKRYVARDGRVIWALVKVSPVAGALAAADLNGGVSGAQASM